jgi:hypothetical protein
MVGRRSHQRFMISAPSEGSLQILHDVLVDRLDRERLTVISRQAGVAGEILTLEFAYADGAQFEMCITESRPIVADGAVRHKLTLQLVHSDSPSPPDGFPVDAGIAGARLAVLTHRLPVRIVNCSAAGCLLDASVRLEKATIGSLRLVIDGQEFVDDIQVARCQTVQGSSSYHIAVEFLWIDPPKRQSLRRGINLGGDPRQI